MYNFEALFTHELSDYQRKRLDLHGIQSEYQSFIGHKAIIQGKKSFASYMANMRAGLDYNLCITSGRALYALSKNRIYIFNKIYSLPSVARELKKIKNCPHIIEAPAAMEMCEKIDTSKGQEYAYICSDQRLPTLPNYMLKHQLNYHEFKVYSTFFTPIVLKKRYDIIVYYSPSIVDSLFSLTQPAIQENTIHLAIGKSTAKALEKYKINSVIASAPNTLGIIASMIKLKKNERK